MKEEVIFDGAGNFTSAISSDYGLKRQITQYADGSNKFITTQSNEPGNDTGTYTVTSDGTLTMTFVAEGVTNTGTISEDGKTIIFSEFEFEDVNQSCSSGIGVGVKKGSGLNVASLNGVYMIHDFNSGFHGGDPDAWGSVDGQWIMKEEVIFDGAGNFTSAISSDYGLKRQITQYADGSNKFITTQSNEPGNDTGTYTVTSDGTLTMTFVAEGVTNTGTISEDGKTIIFSEFEFEDVNQSCSSGIGVGVKKGELLKGDINGDLNVTLADAILALKVAVGLNPAGINLNADVNGDGKIGLAEVIYILQYVAGLRQDFTPFSPFGMWDGTIYDSSIGGSGTIVDWDMKQNYTMYGKWIFNPGGGVVVSLDIVGGYSYNNNQISFTTTDTATMSGAGSGTSGYTLTVQGSLTSDTEASGTYSIDFTDPYWFDNTGNWSVTKG